MKFELKNVGIVEYANIELKGLTVLTGLNDTGKSFISKTVFSIIKTINEAKEQLVYDKYEPMINLLNQSFASFRSYLTLVKSNQTAELQAQAQRQFQEIIGKVNNYLFQKLPEKFLETEILNEINNYFETLIIDIQNIQQPLKINLEKTSTAIKNNHDKIKSLITDKPDDEIIYNKYFDKTFIQKLFQGQLNSVILKNTPLDISISNDSVEFINLSIKDNKTSHFKVNNLLPFKDATIIETPIIIQLTKFITNTLAYPPQLRKLYTQRLDLPYHLTDLIEKISKYGIISNLPKNFTDIYNTIKTTIDGQILFKQEKGGLVFEKEGGEILPFNIASGIKSFGLIQLLLSSDMINQNSVLIIDEPEVHLHPQWEIEYAKILVSLCKSGIPIIISSHSAYFIQALVKYVKEYEITDITKFYFGKKQKNKMSRFDDVTDDLNPIFSTLARPMMNLI